jgi:hypothetical protein
MMLRRRFKQLKSLEERLSELNSLEERLSEEAKRLREEAKLLPPGAKRDELIRKARQADRYRLARERMAALSRFETSRITC